MREKTIPVFTVLKNDAILKNIFVVNSRDFSSPERNGNAEDEVEQTLIVGRHPDCDILLTHPSISKYHLQIRSLPSRQKLFVTDLSSGMRKLRQMLALRWRKVTSLGSVLQQGSIDCIGFPLATHMISTIRLFHLH